LASPSTPFASGTAAPSRGEAAQRQAQALKAWGSLLDQVRGRMEALRAAPDGVLRLELQPREWGRLELRLQRQGGGWRLEVQAEREATAGELRNQAQDLYDRLSGTGLRLEDLRVLGPAPAGPEAGQDGSRAALEADGGPDGSRDDADKRGSRDPRDPEAAPEGSAAPTREREDFASRLERELSAARVRGLREGERP